MATKNDNSGRTKPKTARRGLMRDVLVNWLRHDTSIFHDSFPATEANVHRVILELEQFPECYIPESGTFSVDKVAEWVRVNAAPFAERMEPPPFLEQPAPEPAAGPETDAIHEPTPAGQPPSEEEIKQIHIESAVWDKMDMAAAMEMMESEGIAPEGPAGEWKPGDEIVTQVLPGGFMDQIADDRATQAMDPSELPPGLLDEEFAPGETQIIPPPPGLDDGATPSEEPPRPQVGTPMRPQAPGVPGAPGDPGAPGGGKVLEEANRSLDAAFQNPDEAAEALGSAYRGVKQGLAQLMMELKALTGRDIAALKDPGLQMESVRGTIRETIDGLRKQIRSRPPLSPGGGFGKKELDELLVVVPEDVVEAVQAAGVEPDDARAFLRALVERLGATARENLRLRDEMDKMKAALERQFKVTQQIKLAWKKIADELEEYKQQKTLAREKTEGA